MVIATYGYTSKISEENRSKNKYKTNINIKKLNMEG